jgi:hypothetical protein
MSSSFDDFTWLAGPRTLANAAFVSSIEMGEIDCADSSKPGIGFTHNNAMSFSFFQILIVAMNNII